MNVNDDLDTTHGKLSAQELYCARQRLAREHAALFPTRIAMARWRGDGPIHLSAEQPALRAAWYARVVRAHQAWLERGGFAQHDEPALLRTPAMWQPPLPCAPKRGVQLPRHETHAAEQDLEQNSEQDSAPPCRSDRDGDARQCGTCS